MPLYGAQHVQLGPGQSYQLFNITDSLTPTVASMSFLFLAATGAGTRGYTKTFQVILTDAFGVPVTGSCTMNVQSSLIDVDGDFSTVSTLSIASGKATIYTDIGNSLYYRFQLTALSGASYVIAMVNV